MSNAIYSSTESTMAKEMCQTADQLESDQPCKGLIVERRRMLWLPAITAAALLFGRSGSLIAQNSAPTQPLQKADQPGQLDWDDFLKQCVPVARDLRKDSSTQGEDAYLYWIASQAARLRLKTVPRATLSRFHTLDFGLSYKGGPFIFVEWKIEPHVVYPAHNHPNYSVCTMGIEGETRIRNFEVVGDAPEFSSKQAFHIRETREEIISPGRFSTLSPSRDNIHIFEGGRDGGRGIDITSLHGKDIGFSFLDVPAKPMDPDRRIYEAAWMKLT